MLAIYKKEMKQFFISMIGYAFIAFLLLVVGFCFYYVNVKNASPFVGYSFDVPYIPMIFLILVPVITMKLFADEKATKTDQILFTAPVTIADIVWGKFLAVATIFTIPVIIMCSFPLVLKDFASENIDFPMINSYVAILGFWLMGLSYFAIGLYISSIVDNQVISAVVTFAVLFFSFVAQYFAEILPATEITGLAGVIIVIILIALVYFFLLRGLRSTPFVTLIIVAVGITAAVIIYVINSSLYTNVLQNILYALSIDHNLDDYLLDYFDIPALLYNISIIGVALYLTTQSIQKRRG